MGEWERTSGQPRGPVYRPSEKRSLRGFGFEWEIDRDPTHYARSVNVTETESQESFTTSTITLWTASPNTTLKSLSQVLEKKTR